MLTRRPQELAVMIVATLASGVTLAGEAPQGPPPPTVAIQIATTENMAEMLLVPGTVVSRADARIAAEVSGRLSWVSEVGDVVAEGGVLARIDDALLDLQRQDNEATILRLQAQLDYQASQVQRFRQLAATNAAARDQLEQAESQLVIAQQNLAQARVALAQTRYRLDRSQVRAPFGGIVVERVRQPGEYIQPGGDLVRLVDTSNLEVRAQAPLEVSRFLSAGMTVVVSDREGFTSQGSNTIRTVVGVGDERSRMMEVRVSLDDPRWVTGSAVRVALPRSAEREVLTVSRDALVLRENAIYVFRVNDDSTVERISVEPGIGQGQQIEIIGPVADGDSIVVRGAERLQPGQTVEVSTAVADAS